MASRSRRSSHSSSSSHDSLSSSGWQDADAKDDKEDSPPITCLFCSEQFSDSKSVFQHCKEQHDFDWNQIAGKSGLGLSLYIAKTNIHSDVVLGGYSWF